MHAPLELLAGLAAAANSPVTPSTKAPSAPSSASPRASATQSLPPITPAPSSAVSAQRVPSPMLSAPIPHLQAPSSPPSDLTTSTATAAMGPPSSGPASTPVASRPQKRAKVRHNQCTKGSNAQQKRVLKRSFEAASVPAEKSEPTIVQQARGSEKSGSGGRVGGGGKDEKASEDSQDNKRAMRAERNRQSAAASRERKKRHIKDLEERVKYLTEVNSSLQYRLDMEKQQWEEKELLLQQEIARLRHQLSRESAFRSSPPQNHPMTLHHLTHRGPVTY